MISDSAAWRLFCESEQLTQTQQEQFALYYRLLNEWNDKINLTTIIGEQVLAYHFQDSLSIVHDSEARLGNSLVDVGSGAGFPGIPLAIKLPHIKVTLIEVTQKKIMFLQEVIGQLGLTNVAVYTNNWATFIHTAKNSDDTFVARASLQPRELLALYGIHNKYAHSNLVYWAAQNWVPEQSIKPYIRRTYTYQVGEKVRMLVYFNAPRPMRKK